MEESQLVMGRVYPATAAAPLVPSPSTTVQIGPPQRIYTQAEVEVFARWIGEACGVLFSVEEESEDGGEALRLLRERGLKLARHVMHFQPGELAPWLDGGA